MYKRFGLLIALIWIACTTAAQGLPPQVDSALADLSSKVGRTITLTNGTLTNWQWSQETFDDASLGCPTEGEMYAQVLTPGYIFILEYAGTIYEYHVAQDGSSVRLCSQRSTNEPTPTPPLAEQFSNSLCPAPTEASGPYPRSYVTTDIQVVGTLAVNRLRQTPSTDGAIITEIPNGAVFTVTMGPTCDEKGIVWWQVDYDGLVGWTAEAEGQERYIVPQPPNPLPQRVVIAADNAAQVQSLSTIKANIVPKIAWSRNDLLAMPGGVGLNGVVIYSMGDLSQPFTIERDEAVTALDFIPNNQQVLVGTNAGGVHIWNIATTVNTPFVESLFLQTHLTAIQAVVAHPAQPLFASAGQNALTNAAVNRENAVILANYETVAQEAVFENFGPVTELAFSPDGTQLATGISELRVWDIATKTSSVPTEVTYNSLAYSPNGQFLALGRPDGSIRVMDAKTFSDVATLTGHLREVTGVSFSPDSSLLASVSADGTLRLWNTQSDANLAVVEVAAEGVQEVVFAPDGTLIAVTVDPGTVMLFGVGVP